MRLAVVLCAWPLLVQPVGAQAPPLAERYDLARRFARHELPGRLREISGLAHTADGRLFAHGDEEGTVHEIDPASGAVGKRFHLGVPVVPGDFEGIAVVDDRFFMVTSRGWLYEFREGADRQHVPYRVTDAGVGAGCEVEGLAHDPVADALVLACKVTATDDAVVVFRLPIRPDAAPIAPLRIPFARLRSAGLASGFHPSGIAHDRATGRWILVSARDRALLEVDGDGAVISTYALRPGRHPQPEGIDVLPDGTLVIGDEAAGRSARLTLYRLESTQSGR